MHFLRDRNILFILIVFPFIIMPFDSALVRALRELKSSGGIVTDIFALFIPIASFLGHGATIAIIGLILLIAGRLFKRLQLVFIGKMVLVSYVCAGITVQMLKHLLGRARPRLTDDILFIGPSWSSGFDSFPSGHTTVVFCLAYVFSHYYKRYAVLFYSLSIIAAIERFYNLSHFPSDVFAGACTGVIVGMLILHFNRDGRLAINPSNKTLQP